MKGEKVGSKSTCKAPDCSAPVDASGSCWKHYQQIRRHGRLTPEREKGNLEARKQRSCEAKGCEQPHTAKGYCARHYQQVKMHGRLTPESERKKRKTTSRR